MGAVYATVDDIKALRPLTAQEEQQAGVLIQYASDRLRIIAANYGKDLDSMVEDDDSYASVVRYAVVQAVMNALGRLAETTNGANGASQATQSALGYSMTFTYANAGSFLWFGKAELKNLGLARQSYGALDIYGMG